jgi:transposase-like protein
VVLPKLPVMADTEGRLRVKAQRRDILAAFGRRGESLSQFARRLGIKYSTLARWVQLSRPKHARSKPSLQLLEAVVESSPAHAVGALLALQLPGGVRVEVADEKQAVLAAALIRAWEKPC